jgi:hypothetical protein
MQTLRGLGNPPVLALASMGAFAAYSFQSFSLALAALLGASCLLAPEATALLAIASKPILDCFWDHRGLVIAGHEFNLQSIAGLVLPLCMLTVLAARRELWIRSYVEIAALAYIGVILLSCARSGTPLGGSSSAARMILPFVFLLIGRAFAGRSKRLILLAAALCTYGAVPVVTGLLQLFGVTGPPEGAEPMPSGIYRISGLYYHPLDIAVRCCIAIPFAIFLGRTLPELRQRLAAISWATVMGFMALATLVRSAIIAVCLQILALLWLCRQRAAIAISMAGFATAVLLIPPLRTVFVHALKPIEDGSFYELGTGRGVLFAAQVLGFFDANPVEKTIGRGLLSGPRVIVDYSPIPLPGLERAFEEGRGMTSHNQVLRVLTDSGILGVVSLVVLVSVVVWTCVRAIRTGKTEVEREFAGATFVTLIGIGVYALTTVPLDSPPITWPLWMMVGALVPTVRPEN